MTPQKIGKMSLENTGTFIAKIQFSYVDRTGATKLSQTSGPIVITHTLSVDPGSLGVPDGATVQMNAVVVWGKDKLSPKTFVYEKNETIVANYKISGSLFGSTLDLIDVTEPEWHNWSQNIVYDAPDGPESYFYPSGIDALREIVNNAVSQGGITVRVSGQRHSQPELVIEDNRTSTPSGTNWLVDMSCYADLGDASDPVRMLMDPSGTKVHVNTGVREDELDDFLAKNNKILNTVTAGGFFSLGGMTAVDVHGATVQAPIFAETCSAFTIMGTDGNTITIDETTEGVNGFNAIQFARVSLGTLGIVTSVTIDVLDRPYANTLVPQKLSMQEDTRDGFISTFKTWLANNDRLETFFNPYSAEYMGLSWNLETPAQPIDNKSVPVTTACELANDGEFGAPYEGALEPIAEAAGLAAQGSYLLAQGIIPTAFLEIENLFNKANEAYSDLWLTKAARVIFMSYFIELPGIDDDSLGRAWDGMNAVTSRLHPNSDFFVAGPMEFRFIKGGNSALAGTYTENEDAYFVNLDLIAFTKATEASAYPSELLQFFADVERDWVALGGFPHNGKMYGFYDPSAAAGTYTAPFNENYLTALATRRGERLDAFKAYREQRDPNKVFSNAYVSQLLGL